MSSTATTRRRLNGADEIEALRTSVYNELERVREEMRESETRKSERLDAIDHKVTTCLTILELLGTQAGLLKGK